jgi:endo-1,4-beta-D-glucanase Y
MKRRLFLQTGSATSVALALTACGGGGGGGGTVETAAVGTTGTTAATPGSSAIASTTTRSAVTGPNSYPFGARLDAYVAGILPNNVSNSSMDDSIRRAYDSWKGNIVDVPTVSGGKALRFASNYLTVSEAAGYAMLLTVLMAGHDSNARTTFDALLKTVRARPAYSISGVGQYLMDWRLEADGSSSGAAGGGWNAMDGDLDIAMALLMADRQWGSTGTWNYKQEGVNTINAMKTWNMKADGTTKGLPSPETTRTSDYMISHFRAFAKATGDTFWSTTAIDRAYELIDRMQTSFSPNAGMMPDFIVNSGSNPVPSPGGMGDGTATEMHYFVNAQRNPWRWGTDYVTSGDVRWKNVCDKMINFFKADTGGDPARTATGYRLDGSALDRPSGWQPKGMIGPQLAGAMVSSSHQDYLNALWSYNANNFSTTYYDGELQLLPMIVASGNWWQP